MTNSVTSGARRALGRLLVAGMLLSLGLLAQSAGSTAAADTAPADGTPQTVTADALPTWQVDGVVWSQAVVGNTVYVTGRFSSARPPGVAKGGAGQVPAGNLFAYDIRTGERVASFSHTLNGQGLVIRASHDGSRVYVGGDFTTVDGRPRGHIAAFDVATGDLVEGFAPDVSGTVRAIATDGPWVYFGGGFFYVDGIYRQRLAAVASFNGGIAPDWAPRASTSDVRSMVMAPDGSKLIVGGSFQTIDGVTANGQAALDPDTAAVLPWAASAAIVDYDNGGITDLTTDGTLVYGTGFAFGSGGRFEGSFAADPSDGSLVWVADCLGDTYGIYASDEAVYSVGHAHNCANIDSFPDTNPRVRWQRALAMSKTPAGTITSTDAYGWDFRGNDYPSVLQWFPGLEKGTASGQNQAAWSVTGTGDYVALAGEFPIVNNAYQQGLTRFALRDKAPLESRPRFSYNPSFSAPTVATAVRPGLVRVTFGTAWDRDNARLTYELYRDGTTKVDTLERTDTFWNPATIALTDRDAPAGTYTYRVRVIDPDGNTNWTSWSGSVTVQDATDAGPYAAAVETDDPGAYWRLDERSGRSALDWSGNGQDATATGSGVTWGTAGATNDGGTAGTFSGSSSGILVSGPTVDAPEEVTVEAWFRTTTRTGGKIVGFGNGTSGSSSVNDRHIYMETSGRLDFGVLADTPKVVRSADSYNDGDWHHVVGTVGSEGMAMYVDGALVASDASVTGARVYSGHWIIGGDRLSGWANAPSNFYRFFPGQIDDVAVYPTALGPDRVRAHYQATGRTAPNTPPTASFTSEVTANSVSVDASASTDAEGPVDSYAWDFGDGESATGVTATHAYDEAGTYTVRLTVQDADGASASTTRSVTVEAPNQPPTAAFTASSPQDLVVDVDASGSTDPEGAVAGYAWDFGDGESATGVTAQHTYASAGTYEVRLTVTDAEGLTDTTSRSITVEGPAGPLASDDFQRTLSSDWGAADVGGSWTLLGGRSNYAVASGRGTFRMGSPGTGLAAELNDVATTDADLSVDVSTSTLATGGGQYVYLSGRGSFNDGYRTKLRITSTGALSASLTRVVGGSESTLASSGTGITVSPDTAYRVRLQVVGSGTTTLRTKVWRVGDAEPTSWLLTASDTTASLQAPGGVGVRTYLSGSATNAPVTVSFDNLTVTTAG